MRISALLERPLLLLGAGREGLATLALLRAHGHRGRVHLVGDQPPPQTIEGAAWVPPAQLESLLKAGSVVIRSPGFAVHHPLRLQIDRSPALQTTATCIALAELRAAGVPVIGVTGSKGKSTISTLTHLLLQAAGLPAQLAGNIGVPVLSRLDEILRTRAPVVMELSSYQCDDLQPGQGPQQVIFGSLFPEHLDWHGSLAAYYGAKAKLLSAAPAHGRLHIDQRARVTLVAHGMVSALARTDLAVEWVNQPGGLHVSAGVIRDGASALLDTARMRLPGLHNRENACLAFAAARSHGATVQHLEQVLLDFPGLPFRLQDEGWHGGIRWINDSISTAPEAACAGLEALQGSAATLIAGGQDRGYDYAPLVDALLHWRVGALVTLPDSGAALAAALRSAAAAPAELQVHAAGNLAEAVAVAAQLTPAGATCLFSPAAPSYHAWSGFEARGRDFRQLIESLG